MQDSFPVVYVSLLLVLLSVAAWVVFRQIIKTRRVESALNRLQSKLTKEKGTAQEYYELGSIYLDKKIYAQAISLFQKSLKAEDLTEPDSALVYNALGFAYFAQEQYDLAIRQYKEALKVQPNYITALNNIGHAYERKQLTAQALEAYDQVLAIEPKNATAKRRADSLRKRLIPSAQARG
ncbi:tetratricopeptide repeat protein [Leptothermofonsia sichuanensis E412]|uniref:tetratricopeptide repeat protein n=1 Tax=Leptothermofonsia sichuanensis TaxID=2917832 RepID=UPI001CA6A1EB|nr:tetratricopeptide repeat protein [Leptothermofonsia sichuanensis]QZZ22617.1 tetratricopeptide repeat protein [Leptothermofonsia sichuanensis E412]